MNNPIFWRTECYIDTFYYEAIRIQVPTDGFYCFSGQSAIRLNGYIYEDKFNPMNISQNLFSKSSFYCEFNRAYYFQANSKYILIATTINPQIIGNFSIFAFGSNNVNFSRTSEYLSSK